MRELRKPPRLQPGDPVAILSPSWGGPYVFPHIYEEGIRILHEDFGLRIREFPTTRMSPTDLHRNPRRRAEDLNTAFADPEIKGIFATIGGDDSIRTLPYLDPEVALKHPKILMGYSDMTTLLAFFNQAGLVTFHGPNIMNGFSQLRGSTKEFANHVRALLFDGTASYEYRPYPPWYEGYPEWCDVRNAGKTGEPRPNDGWRRLWGQGVARGRIFGGCIEVLEFLKGTRFWPDESFWDGKILCFETSEDRPPPLQVKWILRNYGMQGIFQRIRGLLFGRARDYNEQQKQQLRENILEVVRIEFDSPQFPIVTEMDFGHTDPQLILPLGVQAELDCDRQTVRLIESPVV